MKETLYLKEKFNISNGRLEFFNEEWRTGGNNKNEKILNEEANIYISSNGDLHGRAKIKPIYTMFGDNLH